MAASTVVRCWPGTIAATDGTSHLADRESVGLFQFRPIGDEEDLRDPVRKDPPPPWPGTIKIDTYWPLRNRIWLRKWKRHLIIRTMMKHRLPAIGLGFLLLIGGIAIAQPKRNVSGARHPNIAAAQRFCQQAWEKTGAAQDANEWDMQGHAKKAKQLLDEANRELKLAAESANHIK